MIRNPGERILQYIFHLQHPAQILRIVLQCPDAQIGNRKRPLDRKSMCFESLSDVQEAQEIRHKRNRQVVYTVEPVEGCLRIIFR